MSFVYCTLYGISSSSSSISIPDHVVKDFEEMTADLTRSATPGAYLVDIFPSMMSLPSWMARFKRDGYRWFQRRTRILEALIEGVQDGVVSLVFRSRSPDVLCADLSLVEIWDSSAGFVILRQAAREPREVRAGEKGLCVACRCHDVYPLHLFGYRR